MTRKQEKDIFEALDEIYSEVHENNIMLRQIHQVVNTMLVRHNQENEDDFNRNVLANLVSEMVSRKRK